MGWTKGSVRDPIPTSDIAKNYVYKLGQFSPNDLAFGVELGLKPNSKRVLKSILVFFFVGSIGLPAIWSLMDHS